MKKLLLPGVALVFCLVLSLTVKADSFAGKNNTETAGTQPTTIAINDLINQATAFNAGASTTPFIGRGASSDGNLLGVLSIQTVVVNGQKTDVLTTNSTFALQNAVSLFNNDGVAFSMLNYGRVPYQHLLIITNNSAASLSSAIPTANTPEPASLLLLGAGLAAFGLGLRRKNKEQ